MTVLAMPDRIAQIDNDEVTVGYDFVCAKKTAGSADAYRLLGSVVRYNNRVELEWERWLFVWPPDLDTYHANAVLITKDNQYVYAAGNHRLMSGDGNTIIYKLDANTGAIVWEVAGLSAELIEALTFDSQENILASGSHLWKFAPDGTELWKKFKTDTLGNPIVFVDVAVDSNDDVYVVHKGTDYGHASTKNVSKYLADGTSNWGSKTRNYDNLGIVIDKDDRLFIVGSSAILLDPNESLWEMDTAGNLLNSADAGDIGENLYPAYWIRIVIDRKGDLVINVGWDRKVRKFSPDFALLWTYEDEGSRSMHSIDMHNRIWIPTFSAILSQDFFILDEDGNLVKTMPNLPVAGEGTGNLFPPVRAVAIFTDQYIAEHTDQPTNLSYPDMCCFLDDTIPKFAITTAYDEGDIVWFDSSEDGYDWLYPMHIGIFQAREDIASGPAPLSELMVKWKKLSRTAPCQNSNWDAYSGFGGIGSGPQFYTLTAIDIKNVSDAGDSEYNGEFLMIRGPGLHGFFFHYDHDRTFRINWTVQEQHDLPDSDTKITMTRENGTKIFEYISSDNPRPNHAGREKLTNVASDLVRGDGEESYDGTCSMYPGRIERWDSTTVWAVDRIVAWQGRFYKADNQNSGSEPPSGDWTVL